MYDNEHYILGTVLGIHRTFFFCKVIFTQDVSLFSRNVLSCTIHLVEIILLIRKGTSYLLVGKYWLVGEIFIQCPYIFCISSLFPCFEPYEWRSPLFS